MTDFWFPGFSTYAKLLLEGEDKPRLVVSYKGIEVIAQDWASVDHLLEQHQKLQQITGQRDERGWPV